MPTKKLTWQDELAIADRTMKAISAITDPEKLVHTYWDGIGELLPVEDYLAVSRRHVEAPYYVITRSSRFTEHHNPWTHHDRLPRLSGGLLGEIAYANRPVIIEDLPARLTPEDPALFYLEGFRALIASPQYDGGEALNIAIMLFPHGIELDHSKIPMLHWQTGLFGRGTQNLVLRNRLSEALSTLDQELQVVGDIQRSLLPQQLPPIPGFELAAHYQTSARAGGDYYDFFPLAEGRWGVFIADVSGHGTPAAVLMAITHALAHARPGTHTPPATLLHYLNEQLAHSYTRQGTFVTAFYAVLDPSDRTLTFSRAGHNPPRVVRGERVLSLDENGSLPLGVLKQQSYGEATVKLDKGDLLLLYTDGITEAMAPATGGAPRQLLGINGLDHVLMQCRASAAADCIARIQRELVSFCGDAPLTDDQTLIAIRCL